MVDSPGAASHRPALAVIGNASMIIGAFGISNGNNGPGGGNNPGGGGGRGGRANAAGGEESEDKSKKEKERQQRIAAAADANKKKQLAENERRKAAAAGGADQKKNKPCFNFFRDGSCAKGDACEWSHDKKLKKQALEEIKALGEKRQREAGRHAGKPKGNGGGKLVKEARAKAKSKTAYTPCSFFQRGECARGDKFRFSHDAEPVHTAAIESDGAESLSSSSDDDSLGNAADQ